jgi:hypothetical protein
MFDHYSKLNRVNSNRKNNNDLSFNSEDEGRGRKRGNSKNIDNDFGFHRPSSQSPNENSSLSYDTDVIHDPFGDPIDNAMRLENENNGRNVRQQKKKQPPTLQMNMKISPAISNKQQFPSRKTNEFIITANPQQNPTNNIPQIEQSVPSPIAALDNVYNAVYNTVNRFQLSPSSSRNMKKKKSHYYSETLSSDGEEDEEEEEEDDDDERASSRGRKRKFEEDTDNREDQRPQKNVKREHLSQSYSSSISQDFDDGDEEENDDTSSSSSERRGTRSSSQQRRRRDVIVHDLNGIGDHDKLIQTSNNGHTRTGHRNECFLCSWGDKYHDGIKAPHVHKLTLILDEGYGICDNDELAQQVHLYFKENVYDKDAGMQMLTKKCVKEHIEEMHTLNVKFYIGESIRKWKKILYVLTNTMFKNGTELDTKVLISAERVQKILNGFYKMDPQRMVFNQGMSKEALNKMGGFHHISTSFTQREERMLQSQIKKTNVRMGSNTFM